MRSAGSGIKSLVELVLTIAVAIALALLIQAFIVKPYRIPSSSMVPTLDIGQRVLTNRLDTTPSVGDIVVFHPPQGANPNSPVCGDSNQGLNHPQACDSPTPAMSNATPFIKRVVGGPGDRIRIVGGHVYRNGKRENDSYTLPCSTSSCNFPQTIVIPPGHYFMMGDNRGNSDDSRFWGPVPASWIIGVAFATYWPPSRIGTL